MSRIKQGLEYVTRSHRELTSLSKRENINILYLWYDFLKCTICHKAILNHYIRGKLYTEKGCNRRKAMTYGRILKVYDLCNDKDSIPFLNSKHLFNKCFSPFIKREWLYSEDMSKDEFLSLCKKNKHLIIKPENGVEGVGIYLEKVPDSETAREELFSRLKSGAYMIEERIVQHPVMSFNNTSVNTVRAHSIIDREGNVHILKMLLRVGVGDSVVDNYAHGGCVYELDPKTGHIISPSLMKTGEEVYIHPGSDIFVLGFQVPNWDKVIKGIKEAHILLPGCRFIGWDVAVTQDGIELIEGNHNPDYELLEFFGSKGWYEKIKPYI